MKICVPLDAPKSQKDIAGATLAFVTLEGQAPTTPAYDKLWVQMSRYPWLLYESLELARGNTSNYRSERVFGFARGDTHERRHSARRSRPVAVTMERRRYSGEVG